MNKKLLFTACCLATLAMPLPGFAEDQAAAPAAAAELTPCQQAAKDLELSTQEEIDAYIKDCEKAHADMKMDEGMKTEEGMKMEDTGEAPPE